MAEIIRITPRARKLAKERGIDATSLAIAGTGYGGGICEKDVIEFLKHDVSKATPLAKKIAELEGVALADVHGSGLGGKINKADVVGKIAEKQETSSFGAPHEAAGSESRQEPGGVGGEESVDGKAVLKKTPYAGIRKIIGDRLSQSMFTAPHLYFTQKVNLEKLLKLRGEVNAVQGKKTSVTDYIAMASVIALQKYHEVNASLIEGTVYEYKSVNLGIAVAAPSGLIVPVVKSAEQKRLIEISEESARLFEKARSGKLTLDDYSGGTFTISNLGMFGIENFTAIINPPEAAILAVSATKDEPCVETDGQGLKTICIKPMMNITLSVDHRLIDGLLAAQFVTEVKRLLESPVELVL